MTGGLWTAFEAAAATGGALCSRGGDPDQWVAEEWSAKGVSIDTRTLEPGEIFVALSDARDGHEFVENAFGQGASAALVAKASVNTPEGKPLLVVRDTLEGLRDLARAARVRNFGKRVGVTGSVGKTSTKEMLRAALSAAGEVHAADKSFNNHWGVPLTLARMPLKADFGVFEIGMNHADEITPLTKLVAPHVAIITTVAAAHLEFFSSVEEIAEAKAEIFTGVTSDGVVILPRDNPHFDLLLARAKAEGVAQILTFGEHEDADARLTDYSTDGSSGKIRAVLKGEKIEFGLGAPGRHQAMNALSVLAAVSALGQSVEGAAQALENLAAGDGRGAQQKVTLKDGGTVRLLDESYNANPTSMAAAISLLASIKPRARGRRIAVLGEMLELGEDGPALHASLAEPLVAAGVDRLYVAGELMDNLWRAAPKSMQAGSAVDANALTDEIVGGLVDGDVVMVKGSNGSKVSEIVRALLAESRNSSVSENNKKTGS